MSQHESFMGAQFLEEYRPSEYGSTWDEVAHDEDFNWEQDGNRLSDLREDITRNGIKTPVLVHTSGHVVDGHHRALYAAQAGHPVPYEVTDQWMYEGQDPR